MPANRTIVSEFLLTATNHMADADQHDVANRLSHLPSAFGPDLTDAVARKLTTQAVTRWIPTCVYASSFRQPAHALSSDQSQGARVLRLPEHVLNDPEPDLKHGLPLNHDQQDIIARAAQTLDHLVNAPVTIFTGEDAAEACCSRSSPRTSPTPSRPTSSTWTRNWTPPPSPASPGRRLHRPASTRCPTHEGTAVHEAARPGNRRGRRGPDQTTPADGTEGDATT